MTSYSLSFEIAHDKVGQNYLTQGSHIHFWNLHVSCVQRIVAVHLVTLLALLNRTVLRCNLGLGVQELCRLQELKGSDFPFSCPV